MEFVAATFRTLNLAHISCKKEKRTSSRSPRVQPELPPLPVELPQLRRSPLRRRQPPSRAQGDVERRRALVLVVAPAALRPAPDQVVVGGVEGGGVAAAQGVVEVDAARVPGNGGKRRGGNRRFEMECSLKTPQSDSDSLKTMIWEIGLICITIKVRQ